MLHTAVLVVFPALMAYAAASDIVTMTIPNWLSLALVAAFPLLALAVGLPGTAILLHLLTGCTVLAITFGMFALGWIGGGDAKLAAAAALWLGFDLLLEYFVLASVAGGMLTIAVLCLRRLHLPLFALTWTWLGRLHDERSGVPYGVALAAAALSIYPRSPVWMALAGA